MGALREPAVRAPVGPSKGAPAAERTRRDAVVERPVAGELAVPRASVAGARRAAVAEPRRASATQETFKRALDLVGAVLGLVLAGPLVLGLIVAIRLDSPGRALFAQERVGRHGRRFRCYKLRTMCADAEERLRADAELRSAYEANGFKLPVADDPRITSFGRFLRASSLDELPQLWNVLRGEMSLVGPRPVLEAELAHYGASRDLVLAVRPGITGAWAVSGRSGVNYPERADIELAYARNWTLGEDLRILARTLRVVLARHGAH